MIDLRKIDKDRPYTEFTIETLREFLGDLFRGDVNDPNRKIVIWCVDDADGVAKNYEDTIQFKNDLRKELKKNIEE